MMKRLPWWKRSADRHILGVAHPRARSESLERMFPEPQPDSSCPTCASDEPERLLKLEREFRDKYTAGEGIGNYSRMMAAHAARMESRLYEEQHKVRTAQADIERLTRERDAAEANWHEAQTAAENQGPARCDECGAGYDSEPARYMCLPDCPNYEAPQDDAALRVDALLQAAREAKTAENRAIALSDALAEIDHHLRLSDGSVEHEQVAITEVRRIVAALEAARTTLGGAVSQTQQEGGTDEAESERSQPENNHATSGLDSKPLTTDEGRDSQVEPASSPLTQQDDAVSSDAVCISREDAWTAIEAIDLAFAEADGPRELDSFAATQKRLRTALAAERFVQPCSICGWTPAESTYSHHVCTPRPTFPITVQLGPEPANPPPSPEACPTCGSIYKDQPLDKCAPIPDSWHGLSLPAASPSPDIGAD